MHGWTVFLITRRAGCRALCLSALLSLIAETAAEPWTIENSAWNVNREPKHEPWNYWGEWPGHDYFPSPADWRELTIYQLLTDRFVDGDPRNNELFAGGFDVRDFTYRHGGDFVGLTSKLHYIKGLGMKGIWISPIFQNGFNMYHQYGQHDFTVLDRRLGTLAELRAMVTEAHRLGMYVLVDVVMNHMGNLFYFEGYKNRQAPFRMHEHNGTREYMLMPNAGSATEFGAGIWCGGFPRWQEYDENVTEVLLSQSTCEDRCRGDPGCFFYLWKDDYGSLSRYHCAGFSRCDKPGNYTDGGSVVYKMKTAAFALNSWCGEAPLWQDYGNVSAGILQDVTSCKRRCASDGGCSYYLWKDDSWATGRYHCAGFSSAACEMLSEYKYGAAKIFKASEDDEQQYKMFSTPAGKQPYADFWYNNTWVADAQYNGTAYDWDGLPHNDTDFGTYDSSDFHHNGDLVHYEDPWNINTGKIYGTMDDLRLEHTRVQAKYIAMTKALISSADVDGFRCDTPMQVPLNFFKTWATEMRAHAKSLGKNNFGLFGEFYVDTGRYATMMGRGKEKTMHGQPDRFIDQVSTLNGGIVYPYYWYYFTTMVYNLSAYADGFSLAYEQEGKCIDTWNPSTGRHEYAQWVFCNNHDNWRMQSIRGRQALWMCLAVITFWPGVPLHYAGDEQDFNTPGSALDGWAREELSVSLAWRAVPTTVHGNPADGDNFDMTSPSYRYISRLNALRRAYFGSFGAEECDKLEVQPVPSVLVFTRGCSASKKVVFLASFHLQETKMMVVSVPWPPGTKIVDGLAHASEVLLVEDNGTIAATLDPLEVKLLVPHPVQAVPPHVVSMTPRHGSTIRLQDGMQLNVTLVFDRDMPLAVQDRIHFDGKATNFSCTSTTCTLQLQASGLSDGLHYVEVPEGTLAIGWPELYAAFRSSFFIDRQGSAIAFPDAHSRTGLICSDGAAICHTAIGATWLRIQNVGHDWCDWRPYEAFSKWQVISGVPVLVQYHAEGSASFVVGDCLSVREGVSVRCYASWHKDMFLKGEHNSWGESSDRARTAMQLVDHFTWGITVQLDREIRAKFAPFENSWEKSYGLHADRKLLYGLEFYDPRKPHFRANSDNPFMSGTEATRVWMRERRQWTEHQSLASGASWASSLWLHPECNLETTQVNNAPNSTRTCCVLFNDLLLNYSVTPETSRCDPAPIQTEGFNPEVDDSMSDGALDDGIATESNSCEIPNSIAWFVVLLSSSWLTPLLASARSP